MSIVVSALLLLGGAAWVWGAMTGRLAPMLAALVKPSWLLKAKVASAT